MDRLRLGTVLHVGCGPKQLGHIDSITAEREIRLDIEPRNQPDIVADARDLGPIGPFDAVYCHHMLEHLTRDDGLKALREFHRVLKPEGMAIIVVPDLEDIRPTDQVLYESEAGPVTGADMYWGMQSMLDQFPHMAHKFGYVSATLKRVLHTAGFAKAWVDRRPGANLLAVGVK